MELKLKSLYVDHPKWEDDIIVDDFLVAIGKKQSNSVYHVAEVRTKDSPRPRMKRHHLKVLKSDLMTCLRRDNEQKLIPITWYYRKKKVNY